AASQPAQHHNNDNDSTLCDLCEDLQATLECTDCQHQYCTACNREIHKPARMAGHKRVPITDDDSDNVTRAADRLTAPPSSVDSSTAISSIATKAESTAASL